MYSEPDTNDRGPLRNVLSRLTMPIDDWAHERQGHRPSNLLVLMATSLASLLVAIVLALAWAGGLLAPGVALAALLFALGVGVSLLLVVMYQVHQYLLRPLAQLYSWALRMCEGRFETRIPAEQRGQFAKLTFHINRLSEALEGLANEMDDMVWQQTERLRVKNQSLEVLFEIAAAINVAESLEALFSNCAPTLMSATGAHTLVVRLRGDDGTLRDFARHGGTAGDLENTGPHSGTRLVVVPLRYQGASNGELALYSDAAEAGEDEERNKLLSNLGKHLGMAVAKAHLDEESRKLTLMRERSALARELHDSLAQTLASLRFQVKMVARTLASGSAKAARREIEAIQLSADEAHTELRELIANFRAPVEGEGLRDALESVVERCRRQTSMTIFAQTEGAVDRIAPAARVQLLRIVREALSNACKHSGARTARVLLRVADDGAGHLLIEDDGCGIGGDTSDAAAGETGADARAAAAPHPGEHIGISIMDERARHLGGQLRIDSEAGDGTRVTVAFRTTPIDSRDERRAHVS